MVAPVLRESVLDKGKQYLGAAFYEMDICCPNGT